MMFPAYPEYQDSGFEWLGEVPSHWSLKRLGHYFDERREKASDKEFSPLSVTKQGILPRLETAAKSQDGDNRKRVFAGDFVINSRSDRKGSAGLSPIDGTVSLICTVLRPTGIDPDFSHHLLRSVSFQEEFYRNGKGIVADLWSTGFQEMKNIVLGVPPLHEQNKIASFLDHETARIDALIDEQKRLIKLLKEKRQAVISHAVTKGLDPDNPMKDSGVEWLGEVPAHWEVTPLKYFCSFKGGGTPSKDKLEYWTGDIPWVTPKDMKSFMIECAQDHITKKAVLDSTTNLIQPWAVLMVVRSGILQNRIPVGMNTVPVSLNQDMKALLFPTQQRGRYFMYFVHGLNESLLLEWRKQGATVESIEHEYLANTVIPLPPEKEVAQIVRGIEEIESLYETLITESEVSMRLLKERRSALISAAVTGKIDVRDWQPPASSPHAQKASKKEEATV